MKYSPEKKKISDLQGPILIIRRTNHNQDVVLPSTVNNVNTVNTVTDDQSLRIARVLRWMDF